MHRCDVLRLADGPRTLDNRNNASDPEHLQTRLPNLRRRPQLPAAWSILTVWRLSSPMWPPPAACLSSILVAACLLTEQRQHRPAAPMRPLNVVTLPLSCAFAKNTIALSRSLRAPASLPRHARLPLCLPALPCRDALSSKRHPCPAQKISHHTKLRSHGSRASVPPCGRRFRTPTVCRLAGLRLLWSIIVACASRSHVK